MVSLFVLSGCVNEDGTVAFSGDYDPESGVVSVDIGDGAVGTTVEVELPSIPGGTLPSDGTLPSTDEPGSTEDSGGGLLPLIMVDPSEDPAEFLRLIPEAERNCLAEQVGSDELEDFLRDPPPDGEEIILGCVSEETVRRVMLGMLAREAGGLTEQDISCLVHELEGVSFRDSVHDEGSILDLALIPQAAVECLSYEQLVRIGIVQHQGPDGPTAEQLRCVLENANRETLADLTEGTLSTEVLRLFEECGIDADPEDIVGRPEPTHDQIACVKETIGEEAFYELVTGQRRPTEEELAAIEECGIHLQGEHEPY